MIPFGEVSDYLHDKVFRVGVNLEIFDILINLLQGFALAFKAYVITPKGFRS